MMKPPGLWIAIVVLSGILTVGAATQETGNQLVVPDKASAKAASSQKLAAYQDFAFQLQFSPAPDGYGGGEILATFKNEGGPPPSERYSNQGRESLLPPVRARAELHDGQAIYTLKLTIRESMSPGKWKLTELSLGRRTQKIIHVPEDVSFFVAGPRPLKVDVQGPPGGEAGHEYTFTVTLDRYPADVSINCKLQLSLRFRQGGPTGLSLDPQRADIVQGKLSYKFSQQFEPDFPSGPWEVAVEDSAYNSADPDEGCWYPQLQGDVLLPFNIEPARNLVTPTSVVVTVNPSQIELFREEADRLRAKERRLREQLASENPSTHQVVLKASLEDALADLDRTKNKFMGFQKELEPAYRRTVDIFFDDIRRTYAKAQDALEKAFAKLPREESELRQVHYALSGLGPGLDPTDAVLDSIVHNEAAYDVVASSKLLTFTLEVDSRPDHANISYKLRGDDYRSLPHKTDWRIENLARAVYFVRVQKDGYEDQEKSFDAIKDTGTSISFDLKRKSSRR
jgi:hypothetical protein